MSTIASNWLRSFYYATIAITKFSTISPNPGYSFALCLRLMCYFYSIRASKCEGVCVVCVRRAPAEHTKHKYFSFLYNNFIYSDILGMESSRAKGPINVSHSSSSSSASYYEAIYSSCRIPYSQVSLLVFMHSVFFNFLSTLFHPLLLFDSTKWSVCIHWTLPDADSTLLG